MANFECKECGDVLPQGDTAIQLYLIATGELACANCRTDDVFSAPIRERNDSFVRVLLLEYSAESQAKGLTGFMTCVEYLAGGVIENAFWETAVAATEDYYRLEREYLATALA